MKMQLLVLCTMSGAALCAQTPEPKATMAYQNISVMAGPGGGPAMIHKLVAEGLNGPPVTGKPFSGTQQHHSLQVLADGTRIESTETTAFYRDEQGRTRNEDGPAGATHVMIHDPVAGSSIMLDPANKVAHKLPGPPPGGMLPPPPEHAGAMVHREAQVSVIAGGGGNVIYKRTAIDMPESAREDLGTETINGVLAQGTRTTMTIPTGQIGNDRPIQVVNERWYSSDLQTLVKSSNKDPRFGETTFDLTNVDRAAPPASLFQIPADYTVDEGDAQATHVIEKHAK